ncbi:MAG: sugar phosphate isomerase/epimerase [Spirochaetaceae bacterium]|nr:sugar phosphate isomerase/epimerase [Spirochaetaceae bacterium]
MKLGLFTAAFPGLALEAVADWAAANGFEALELAAWPSAKAERRYAGVSHVDAASLDRAGAARIRALLAERGLVVSSLGYYPNPLDPDPAAAGQAVAHLKRVIDAAALLEAPVVGTFVGRDWRKGLEENLEAFAAAWPPIVRYAAERGVRIGIENCPMLFSADEWPAGKNLATSPAVWKRLWEIIPDGNFGLNLDPSHLVWQMIDHERVVREFGSRIFHVHAKDLMIDREGLYRNGILSLGMGWQVPRLPGLGDIDWKRFVAALYRAGYDGVVSVEHEDRDFEGSEELVKRGFLIARDTLRSYVH